MPPAAQAVGSMSRLVVRAAQLWDFDFFFHYHTFRYKTELLETQIYLASLSRLWLYSENVALQ